VNTKKNNKKWMPAYTQVGKVLVTHESSGNLILNDDKKSTNTFDMFISNLTFKNSLQGTYNNCTLIPFKSNNGRY
jgi:hypothetical protein